MNYKQCGKKYIIPILYDYKVYNFNCFNPWKKMSVAPTASKEHKIWTTLVVSWKAAAVPLFSAVLATST